MQLRTKVCLLTVVGIISLGSSASAGITYPFAHIVEPDDTPAELAAAANVAQQLFVTVSPVDSSQVSFLFENIWTDEAAGDYECTITDIYFDGATDYFAKDALDKFIVTIEDDPPGGVWFKAGGSPPDLPGGDALPWHLRRGRTRGQGASLRRR